MLKELKTAKWYWFIPLLSLYFSYDMSKWTMSGKTYQSRFDRHYITIINISFINAFVFLGVIYQLFFK